MTPYLVYVFDRLGADDLYVLACRDDAEARERARGLLAAGAAAVEVWDEERPVWAAGRAPATPVAAPVPALAA